MRSKSVTLTPVALTIAGFDPSAGAGITADIKTFAAYDIYGMTCITALTVQSTQGVRSVEPLSPGQIRATLDCLAQDVSFSGIKIGMLASGEVAHEVAAFLASAKLDRTRVVLDPVLRSSSGAELLDASGLSVLRRQILPWVGWITPNVQELAVLVGNQAAVSSGAAQLQSLAAGLANHELNVVVTGGDSLEPNDFLLTADGNERWFPGQKVQTESTHGTGCAFSTALLCERIRGREPAEAVQGAKNFVTCALQTAYPVGMGKGPLNHLYRMDLSSID